MKKVFAFVIFSVLVQGYISAQTQALADTSFELTGAGGTQWTSTSTNFGTVICKVSVCGNCNGLCIPKTGTYYAWFGGTANNETGTLTQSFTTASGGIADLVFWLKIPAAGGATDSIVVQMDGNTIWYKTGPDTAGFESAYKKVVIDLGNFDAGNHTLHFRSRNANNITYNVLIDDVSVVVGGLAGAGEYDLENGIAVFTDAFAGVLNVDINFAETQNVSVYITDMAGRTVCRKELGHALSERIALSTSGWPAGIYAVTVGTAERTITKKIYVAK